MADDQLDPEVIIFNSVLRLPEGKRAAFLDAACAGEAALRRTIEDLLEINQEAGAFFACPARGIQGALEVRAQLSSSGGAPSPASPLEKVGDRIDRYKLLQPLGEGGCGVVYLAEQEEPVRRRVALKVIKLGMDTRSVIARFEAERQVLALMDHPNIARALDVGATDTGRPYFVMELVRGIPITDYCDEHHLSTSARLGIFVQVCQAIQHAHQKGIIHRDIKPSNVLVASNDGAPLAKVIDFGIAKATEGSLSDKTLFTAFEQFLGTPAYMSPEQARTTTRDIDTRSDIYSLGVLLYELLTGRTPFDAKMLLEKGLDETRRTILEQEPARPSTRLRMLPGTELTEVARHRKVEPSKLIGLLRGDLDWIVMKALEKDRKRRYDTAIGLARDIQRHLANEPVLARPPRNLYKFQKLVRRNKLTFATVGLIAVVLVSATIISARQASLARKRLNESEAISKFLIEVFQSPDPARNSRAITLAEALGSAAKKLQTDLQTQPERRARLLSTLASTFHKLGLDHEAIALQEQVRDYDLAALGLENPETLKAMHLLGLLYEGNARKVEALQLQERVLKIRLKVLGREHPDTIWAMNNLSFSYDQAGRPDEALKLREQVLTLRRKVCGPRHLDTLQAMNNLALSYDDLGRRTEALNLREEASTLYARIGRPDLPEALLARLCLATSYFEAGRLNDALKLQEEVVAARVRVSGPKHPDTLWAMHNLATTYFQLGRQGEALKLREEVLSRRREVLGPTHYNTLWSMHALATSYEGVGRDGEALELREQVLGLRRKINGPEHAATLAAMGNLADSYAKAGRQDEALALRRQVLSLRHKLGGEENPATLEAMQDLATSCDETDRVDEGLALREAVLQQRKKVLGAEHPDTLWAMHNLALSYDHIGRREEALKLREEVLGLRRKVLGPEDFNTLWSMHTLASSYDDMGRRDEALKLREHVLAIRAKNSGPEHASTLDAMEALAISYEEAGRREEARGLREQALAARRNAVGASRP